MKYSRQRESILQYLSATKCHPTAETVYQNIQAEYPHISLGTVYRNLTLLTELGKIKKITGVGCSDRFDGNISPHYHFICRECGAVLDLEMDELNHIDLLAAHNFDGRIDGHIAHFYGICPECINKNTQ